MNKTLAVTLLLTLSSTSHAYIGPGMGGGVIAATFGVIAAIIFALWGILYYPIKRKLRERKENEAGAEQLSDND